MAAKDELGRLGEELAVRHLRAAGMVIIERNWRCDRGEIDIVAADGSCIVVCEVKTRRTCSHGTPLEAITVRKVRRLRVLAHRWLEERAIHAAALRIDAVGIVIGAGVPSITHVRGVS